MQSTFRTLEIGRRGVMTAHYALNVTNHNIANANTEGYSRQRADLVATRPYTAPSMTNGKFPQQIGTGVESIQLIRIRDQFADAQFRNEYKFVGYYDSRVNTYNKLQSILSDSSEQGTGLQAAMDKLWKSWQDLVNHAETGENRTAVIGNAQGLTDVLHHVSKGLLDYQADLNNEVFVKVNEVNSLVERIRELNEQISRIVPHGYNTNDLDDQRDLLIDQLSKLVDIKVTHADRGMVDITVAGGQPLVTGKTANFLEANLGADGFYHVNLNGAPFTPSSGSLLETMEARGILQPTGELAGIVPDYIEKINTLASVLAREVNDLHRQGKSLHDINNGTDLQLPFFISKAAYDALPDADKLDPAVLAGLADPTEAADMIVNPLLVANTDYLAAAGNVATGVADGTTAQAIANIKQKIITAGLPNSNTLDGYYAAVIGQLGIDGQRTESLLLVKTNLVKEVDTRRQSVASVSLDDEMVDMIKFQQAYNAASRAITTFDEMLDKIINGMGIVGR